MTSESELCNILALSPGPVAMVGVQYTQGCVGVIKGLHP